MGAKLAPMNADEIQKAARDRLTAIDAQLAALAAERLTLRKMLGIEPAAARDLEFGVLRLPPGLSFPAAPYEVHVPTPPPAWQIGPPPGVYATGQFADRDVPTIHDRAIGCVVFGDAVTSRERRPSFEAVDVVAEPYG
jgi:hypothetical protein